MIINFIKNNTNIKNFNKYFLFKYFIFYFYLKKINLNLF